MQDNKYKKKKVSFATLVTKTQALAEQQRKKTLKKSEEAREEKQYWRSMLDEQQKMKTVLLKPSLPLEESDPIDVDKTSTIAGNIDAGDDVKVDEGSTIDDCYEVCEASDSTADETDG